MRIRVIQPPYPQCTDGTPATVSFMIEQLRQCDESLDLILLPECCNLPAGCSDSLLLPKLVQTYGNALFNAVKETAVRCNAVVGINLYIYGKGYETVVRNATLLFNKEGRLVAQYNKQHLPAGEYSNESVDHSYLEEKTNPFCAVINGVRYAFLTCYDTYFTEFIHRISLEKPDVVLICSLQRAERSDILEMQAKNCAFICNSYVVRSSYHMGPEAKTGGCSMIVAPDGNVLQNFGQGLGNFDCEIEDIHWKYCRSNGFGQPEVPNDVFQTLFRTPWCYRVGGSGVKETNQRMAFPRLCAQRGFTSAAPENSIAGIGLAIALGAQEVAIDLRVTADGIPVLSRDPDALRLTGKTDLIRDMTWSELRILNPGKGFAAHYDGVGYAALEEVFAMFPRRAIFNLHIPKQDNPECCRSLIRTILALANRYDCAEHFYISSEERTVLAAAEAEAPAVERCLIVSGGSDPTEAAKAHACSRIQFCDDTALALLPDAKAAGLRCNVSLQESSAQALAWLDAGADCIMAENFLSIRTSFGFH